MQEQLQLLNQISDELNKDLDLDNMLQRVIDLTVAHFRAATGSIILFDEKENRRVSKYILQQRDISDDRAHRIVGQVLNEGFAGWVLEHGAGDVIFDTVEDKRWVTYPNQPYKARSVIATPLTRRNRALGVLTMTHEVPGHFTKENLPVLNAITGQAAIALENAQLFYQTERERNTLSAIINSTQDAIIVIDPESQKVSLMNPAAEKLLKIAPNLWQGATLESISPIEALTAIATAELESEDELRLTEDRTFQPSLSDVPDVGRLILLHDISALKALDKMKSEFVIAFTHDLAAPLAAIKGYLELMRIDGALTDRQEEDLVSIRMSVDQMRTLITDLQELTRLETLKNMLRRDITLNDTLQKTVETFQPIAETKEIRLSLKVPAESLTTYGNPALISRAVDNLVENAIKYTRPKGQIGVSLSANNGEVFIAVKDTGIGIPNQKLSNIFEKFFRAHPPSENEIPGSGLGLSIVKTIIERHGGRISVESEVNVGSTFTIALPQHDNGTTG